MKHRFSVPLALFALVAIVPLLASLVYATLYSLGFLGWRADGFTLAHWQKVGSSGELWWSVLHSAWIALAVTAISTGVALGLTLVLGRNLDGGVVAQVSKLPLAVPGVVIAFVLFSLFSAGGFFNRGLFFLGLIPDPSSGPSLVQDQARVGLILAQAYGAVAFLMLVFRSTVRVSGLAILDQVAASLGASPWQRLRRVTLPLLLSRNAGALALVFVITFGAYEAPLILDRQSPQMIALLILRKFSGFRLEDKAEAMVMTVVYAGLMLVGLWTFTWLSGGRNRGTRHD
jgi:putative spermidine/putrescine transport system permease protein